MRDALNLMFVVGRLYAESSGVTRIMCDQANALGRRGAHVTLYAAEQKNGPAPASHLLHSTQTFVSERGAWLGGLSHSPKLRERIERDIASVDVVHSHSLWMLPNHYASSAARRAGKPVVFTRHAALEPWAIARSRWKKRPVAWWWQDRDLRDAACIHVNSRAEISGVRSYGLENPIAILPNGVDLAPFDSMPTHRDASDKYTVLFLSRLHEKKGLAHLIDAWRQVVKDHRDWQLVLAGPDDGFEQTARQRVEELGLTTTVTFTGPLQGDRKMQALASADAFVLPSFSEGFSMSLLEAMAARLPVLLTPGCNFPEVAKTGAGIEVESNARDTERGMRGLIEMSREQRRAMGERGRVLIEQSYTWDAIAAQMMELYAWMVGGGSRPLFVEHG